jgi:arylsulfatase A-like enzyme
VKTTQWEGGIRTPGIIWSPVLRRGVFDQLMHITDWMPTFISAAGGSLEGIPLDGVDQWRALQGNESSRRREALLQYDEVRRTYAVRKENWKIVSGKL